MLALAPLHSADIAEIAGAFAAQRLYVLRGYVPDACGITAHGRRVAWGDDVKIDDDLVLWLTKSLF